MATLDYHIPWPSLIHGLAVGSDHPPIALAVGALAALYAVAPISLKSEENRGESAANEVAESILVGDSMRVLVIGSGNVAVTLAEKLEEEGGYHVVGLIDDAPSEDYRSRFAMLGGRADALALIDSLRVAHVFVAYAPTWQQELAETLATNNPGVSVAVVPSSYEARLKTRSVESYGDVAVIRVAPRISKITEFNKRFFDLIASVAGMLLFFPILLLAGVFIKLSSPGPILFRQMRVGRHGKKFGLYKLRTMRVDAEAKTGPPCVCRQVCSVDSVVFTPPRRAAGDSRACPIARRLSYRRTR